MLVPGVNHHLHLGFSCLVVGFLGFAVVAFVVRRKWQQALARQEEIKRLLILASEEAARAELEASIEYYGAVPLYYGGAPTVSAPRPFQCAVCYSPTTTRCARCKAVRYCSGKCQIVHWRQGHKEECHPPSIENQIIDEASNSTRKAVDEEHGTYSSFETEGSLHAKPIITLNEKVAISSHSFPSKVPSEKDDGLKPEVFSDVDRTNSTSSSFSAAFPAGPSSTTTASKSFDDVSISESICSNDLEKLDRLKSADLATDMHETTFCVNYANQAKPLPDSTSLVDDVHSLTGVSKLNHIQTGCSDGESKPGPTSFSGSDFDGSDECSVSQPFTNSSGFWGGVLDSSRFQNDTHDDSDQLITSRTGDGFVSNSDSFLSFSFFSGNTVPPLQSHVLEANAAVSDRARHVSLGNEKPIGGPVLSKNDNLIASKLENTQSPSCAKSDYSSNGNKNDSHMLRSREVGSRRSVASSANQGDSVRSDASTVTCSASLSSNSEYVINSSSMSHLSNSREVGSLSYRTSAAHLPFSNGVHSVPCEKSGRVDGLQTSTANTSKISNYSPNASNGLKTSMRKVVDQFRPSKLSKNYSSGVGTEIAGKYRAMGFFSYELFVKLYSWNKVELHPCGLLNCGNSCYANVVLQCLAFTPPLTSFLLQGFHSKACVKKEWCLMCEFESLILKAKEGNSPLSPIGILSQLRNIGSHLSNGREEDAHEFLRCAIDTMQSVCLKEAGVNATGSLEEETTLIGLTFGGYLRSKIKCMKCQGKSERYERMMDLTVEIHGDIGTLDEALRQFTGTEILDGENKYDCNRCKSYEKAKKKLTISDAPNVLTIALKRFQSGKFGKLNKSVEFPDILDLAPYMSGSTDKSPIYRLYGVVVHLDIMNAAFSGHYVCYVKNIQGKWFEIDDSSVKPVQGGMVLKREAYMLLYSRCSPRAPRSIRNKVQKVKVVPSRPGFQNRKHVFESDTTSDNSSIFSNCSDEGSTGTESNRNSSSTDDLSEFTLGSSRNLSDNDTLSFSSSSYSPDEGGEGSAPFLKLDKSRKIGNSSSRETDSERIEWANRFDDVRIGLSFRRSTRERN